MALYSRLPPTCIYLWECFLLISGFHHVKAHQRRLAHLTTLRKLPLYRSQNIYGER